MFTAVTWRATLEQNMSPDTLYLRVSIESVGVGWLVAEARAGLLPLALGAPQLAVFHAVHLAALLVVGARAPPRAAAARAA